MRTKIVLFAKPEIGGRGLVTPEGAKQIYIAAATPLLTKLTPQVVLYANDEACEQTARTLAAAMRLRISPQITPLFNCNHFLREVFNGDKQKLAAEMRVIVEEKYTLERGLEFSPLIRVARRYVQKDLLTLHKKLNDQGPHRAIVVVDNLTAAVAHAHPKKAATCVAAEAGYTLVEVEDSGVANSEYLPNEAGKTPTHLF